MKNLRWIRYEASKMQQKSHTSYLSHEKFNRERTRDHILETLIIQ